MEEDIVKPFEGEKTKKDLLMGLLTNLQLACLK